MKTIPLTAAVLALSATGVLRAQTPDERVPQKDAAQEFPRWLRQVRVEGLFLPGEIETDVNKIEAAYTPSIAVDSKGVVHIAFAAQTKLQRDNQIPPDIYYTHNRYKDRQANGWAKPLLVFGSNQSSTEPDIYIGPDDTPHIVWTEAKSTIYYATISYSDTSGAGATAGATPLSAHHQPAITVTSPGNVRHVVATGYDGYIYHISSSGGAWSAPVSLPGSLGGTLPRVHYDSGGNPHVAFPLGARLTYSRRIGAWSTYTNALSSGVQNADLFVARDDRIHLTWDTQNVSDSGATTIKYCTVPPGGTTFSATENVSTLGGFLPRIVVDSRLQPHVNWIYNRPTPHKSVSYAARIARADIGADPWKGRQEPTSTITRDPFARLEIAINANDNIYLTFDVADWSGGSGGTKDGYRTGEQPGQVQDYYNNGEVHRPPTYYTEPPKEEFNPNARGAIFFSKVIEFNLGGQDPYGTVAFAPGAAGNAANGNLTYALPLFATAGVGIPTAFSLVYNAHEWDPGVISQGWTTSYHITMTDHRDGGVKSIQFGDGTTLVFTNQSGTVTPESDFGEFSYFTAGFSRRTTGGSAYDFDVDTGKLTRITDRNLNQLNLAYGTNAQGKKGNLSSVQDSANRTSTLTYTGGRLTQVSDPAGKTYTLAYDADPVKPKLISVMRNGPPALTTQFSYHAAHNAATGERKFLLKELRTPRNNPWKFTYFQDNRLRDSEAPPLTQPNVAGGNFRRFSYTSPVSPTASSRMVAKFKDRLDNETTIEVEYKRSLVRKVIDPAPFTTYIQRDFDGTYRNLKTFRDRAGSTEVYKYRHELGGTEQPAHVKNLIGQVFKPPANSLPGTAADLSRPFVETEYSDNVFAPLLVKDVKGNTTRYYYDGDSSYPSDPNRNVVKGNLTKIAYPAVSGQAATEEYTYDGQGRVTSHTSPENVNTGYQTTFSAPHSLTGQMTRIQEPEHTNPQVLDFNVMGLVTFSTAPMGGLTEARYDNHHRAQTFIPPAGDEGKTITYAYDNDGNLDSVSGPGAAFSDTDYDEWGRAILSKRLVSAGVEAGSTAKYDAEGNVRESRDANQNVTTVTYDNLHRPDVETQPGLVIDNDYNPSTGFLSARKVGTGGAQQTTSFTVTAWGAPKVTTLPGGGTSLEVTYEERGFPELSLRKEGTTTRTGTKTRFDEWGRARATTLLTDFTAQTGLTTLRDLDRNSNLTKITDPSGQTTSFEHDRSDRRLRTKDHAQNVLSQVSYNDNDLRETVKAPHPETGALLTAAKYGYNLADELKTATDALGNVTTYFYDALGNPVQTQLPPVNGVSCRVRNEYDLAGRLVAMTHDPGSPTQVRWQYRYDLAGNRTEIIDPRGNLYQFRYDGMNRLTEMEYPSVGGGRFVETWSFDARGNVSSHVDREGKIATFTYDIQDRPLTETHIKAGVTLASVTRTYDNGTSNLLTITDAVTKVKLSFTNDAGSPGYDKLNRLTHVRWILEAGTSQEVVWKKVFYVNPDGSPGYDLAGNLVRMVDPEGHVYQYGYDTQNRLASITRTRNGGTAALVASFAYHGVSGLRREVTLQGGTRTAYRYDVKSRLTSIETSKSDGTVLSRFDYEYDARDRRTKAKLEHLNTHVTYTYDCLDRLTGETWTGNATAPPGACTNNTQPIAIGNQSTNSNTASAVAGAPGTVPAYTWTCAYDANGNRTSQTKNGTTTTYAYDAQNRLTSETTGATTITYGYDRNGNQITRTQGTTVESFDHDYQNRVRAYRKVVSGSTTVSYFYRYTPNGERLAKVNLLATSSNEEWFMYDGADATADYVRSSNSTSTQISRTYVNGRSVDSKIARIEAGSTESTYFYLGDAVGTVHELVDAAGSVSRRVLSTAWGESLPNFTPLTTVADRHGLTQRELDSESALMHYRARSYDPRLGRFLQTDPMLAGRPSEHYVYASNSPVSLVDPMGLQAEGHHPWQIFRGDSKFAEGHRYGWKHLLGADFEAEKYLVDVDQELHRGKGGLHKELDEYTMKLKEKLFKLKGKVSQKYLRGLAIRDVVAWHAERGVDLSLLRSRMLPNGLTVQENLAAMLKHSRVSMRGLSKLGRTGVKEFMERAFETASKRGIKKIWIVSLAMAGFALLTEGPKAMAAEAIDTDPLSVDLMFNDDAQFNLGNRKRGEEVDYAELPTGQIVYPGVKLKIGKNGEKPILVVVNQVRSGEGFVDIIVGTSEQYEVTTIPNFKGWREDPSDPELNN